MEFLEIGIDSLFSKKVIPKKQYSIIFGERMINKNWIGSKKKNGNLKGYEFKWNENRKAKSPQLLQKPILK